ncbi:MAG TPA: efflux transporter outer membrane subunit [Planctomycetota bacterium]|nr:efflux transporter outer membrane subunit [Planctomycetota bacterium]
MTCRTPGRLGALAAAAWLAACAAAPPPSEQSEVDVDVPRSWTAADPEAAVAPHADIDARWWREFGDAELDRLVELALQNNRDVRAALARLDAAAADRTIAGAAGWPEADVGLDALRARRLFLGFPFGGGGVPSSTTTTYGLSLSLRWELDLWGRVRAGESAAIADLQAAAADVAGAQLSLAAQVCKAWFAAVEANQQVALAEATATALRATTDDVRDRYRRGLRPALEVHLAATNLANAEAAIAQRRDTLQRARRQIDLLVGRYPRGLAAPATMPDQLPDVPAGLPSELLQRRPDLVAAERRLAAAGCRVEEAKAALYPRLSLTGSGGTSSEDLADLVDNDFRIWSIGANLLQPLFRGGALRAEVVRRQAERAEAIALYGGAVLRACAEVEDTLAADTEILAKRTSLADASDHARQFRDLARDRWQLGLADFLAVADGQRQAFLAESALIAADRQRVENRIDLFLALGGGYGAPAPAEPAKP